MQTVLNELKMQFDIDDLQKKKATLPWCGVCLREVYIETREEQAMRIIEYCNCQGERS